jgi:signal transduction histidine kinase
LGRLSVIWKWSVAIAFAFFCVAVVAGVWVRWRHAARAVPTQSYELQAGSLDGWKSIGGNWKVADGVVYNDSYERGAKLITGSSTWRDYTLRSDIRFEGNNADMGMVVRTTNEMEGVDTYDGYYIGLRTLDNTMVVGRSHFGWAESRPVVVPGGVHPSIWYRLRVTAVGCHLAVSVQNLSTKGTAWLAFYEPSCVESGRIGLRSLNASAMWKNISIAPATWSDYEEMRSHAGSVEQPEFPPNRPWWTPWHTAALFVCALLLALALQLVYFRMQRWKATLIVQERERLAHEIHDTMAQSFAGIGYQIQGIRSGVVRADHVDARRVAEQLSVTYELVRNCHEEASRTIAVLSSISPLAQQDLLGLLAETARRIAGDKIQVTNKLHGNPSQISLRLADTLLHVGREAIANAVHHAAPTRLIVTLRCQPDYVELSIEDNGSGFEVAKETAGFGILGMQKRARDVAGTLEIVSTPGQGTHVVIRAKDVRDTLRDRLLIGLREVFRTNTPHFDSR